MNYETMSNAELRAIALTRGRKFLKSVTKSVLIEFLESAPVIIPPEPATPPPAQGLAEQAPPLEPEEECEEITIEELRNNRLATIQSIIDDYQQEIDEINQGLHDEKLINNFNKKEEPKATQKKEGKRVRTKIDREAYLSMLPEYIVLVAKHTNGEVRVRLENGRFVDMETGTVYENLHGANKRFIDDICKKVKTCSGWRGNAWEHFKAENQITKTTRSIKNLHADNWLEGNEEDYICI